MKASKDELVKLIEISREKLNKSIDQRESYENIYQNSIELDQLIEQYLVSGF